MKCLALLALLVLSACGRSEPAKSEPAARLDRSTTLDDLTTVTLRADVVTALGLHIAPAVTIDVAPSVRTAGEVMVADGRDLTIAAPVGGRIVAQVLPRAGERVRAGQTLLTLVPLATVDRDSGARAVRDLEAARAEHVLTGQRVARAEAMAAEHSGSVRAVEEARAQERTAAATVTSAEARVKVLTSGALDADVSLAIKSPVDGWLRSARVSPGQTVPPGAVLFELATAGRWIRASLAASDNARLTNVSSASVTRLGGGASLSVNPIDGPPSADPQRGTVDRFFAAPGIDWTPGERVVVDIVGERADVSAIAVPHTAVVRDAEGGAWVYVATGEHRFRRRRVDVERSHGSDVVVRAGLAQDTPVVTVGAAELWGFEMGADR